MTWRRKNNRLEAETYVGPNAYLVTVATESRAACFSDPEVVSTCLDSLEAAASNERVTVHAYVFMPDHCHLLVEGSDNAQLSSFMKRFKQITAFRFKQRTGRLLWQKSYHDHVLRRDEDLHDVANYIAANPVRAGLVASWEDYPFTGGPAFAEAPSGDPKVAATPTPEVD